MPQRVKLRPVCDNLQYPDVSLFSSSFGNLSLHETSLLWIGISLTFFAIGPSNQVLLINSFTSFLVAVVSDMMRDRRVLCLPDVEAFQDAYRGLNSPATIS
jgi:hypothetical protein